MPTLQDAVTARAFTRGEHLAREMQHLLGRHYKQSRSRRQEFSQLWEQASDIENTPFAIDRDGRLLHGTVRQPHSVSPSEEEASQVDDTDATVGVQYSEPWEDAVGASQDLQWTPATASGGAAVGDSELPEARPHANDAGEEFDPELDAVDVTPTASHKRPAAIDTRGAPASTATTAATGGASVLTMSSPVSSPIRSPATLPPRSPLRRLATPVARDGNVDRSPFHRALVRQWLHRIGLAKHLHVQPSALRSDVADHATAQLGSSQIPEVFNVTAQVGAFPVDADAVTKATVFGKPGAWQRVVFPPAQPVAAGAREHTKQLQHAVDRMLDVLSPVR